LKWRRTMRLFNSVILQLKWLKIANMTSLS
jgi:hypothetical protein